jgi:hypothetical protein
MIDPLIGGVTATIAGLVVAIGFVRWLWRRTPTSQAQPVHPPAVADPDDVLVAIGGSLKGYYINFDLIVVLLETNGPGRQSLALRAVASFDEWKPYVLLRGGSPVEMMTRAEAEKRGFKPFIRS